MKNIILAAIICLVASVSSASAAVDPNSATVQQLDDNMYRVGSVIAARIVAEREANGEFVDAADLQKRVKGVGAMTISKTVDLNFDGNTVAVEPVKTPATK